MCSNVQTLENFQALILFTLSRLITRFKKLIFFQRSHFELERMKVKNHNANRDAKCKLNTSIQKDKISIIELQEQLFN